MPKKLNFRPVVLNSKLVVLLRLKTNRKIRLSLLRLKLRKKNRRRSVRSLKITLENCSRAPRRMRPKNSKTSVLRF